MARAGFYAIESHRIRFGRDGEWYSDGERIANRAIAQLFSRCVTRDAAGGYQLRMGDERATLEVEDTPFVIRQIDGDLEHGIVVELNDETREPLDPGTLRCGTDDALYCRVKRGEYEARFLRPAHYALAALALPHGEGFALEIGGRRYPIERR